MQDQYKVIRKQRKKKKKTRRRKKALCQAITFSQTFHDPDLLNKVQPRFIPF